MPNNSTRTLQTVSERLVDELMTSQFFRAHPKLPMQVSCTSNERQYQESVKGDHQCILYSTRAPPRLCYIMLPARAI